MKKRELWKLERLGPVGEKRLSGLELKNQDPNRKEKNRRG